MYRRGKREKGLMRENEADRKKNRETERKREREKGRKGERDHRKGEMGKVGTWESGEKRSRVRE